MERTCEGYNLVELLTVLAVAAVLVTLSIPELRRFTTAAQLSGVANDILGDLFLARSEAIKRRLRVVLCKSRDGATCALAGNWEQGWIVYVDADADGQRAAGEPLIRKQQALPLGVRLTGTSTMSKYVSYAPTGAARTIGGGFQAGTLTVCATSDGSGAGRQIIISSSGRPRTQRTPLVSCS